MAVLEDIDNDRAEKLLGDLTDDMNTCILLSSHVLCLSLYCF